MSETGHSTSKSNPLAVYAAVVATAALGWQIYLYVDAKPKLEILFVSGGYLRRTRDKPGLPGQRALLVGAPTFRFLNTGSKPVSVYLTSVNFDAGNSESPLEFSRWDSERFGESFKLNENEVKEWEPRLAFRQRAVPLPDTFEISGQIRVFVGSTNGYYDRTFEANFTYLKSLDNQQD